MSERPDPTQRMFACPFTEQRVVAHVLPDRAMCVLNEDVIAEMIAWLRDCNYEDEHLVGRTNREIVREVTRTCDGALAGFLRDSGWKPCD